APGTREGDKLLAHELTHVVQGQRSGVQRKEAEEKEEKEAAPDEKGEEKKADGEKGEEHEVSEPGDPAEQEAEEVAGKVADGEEAGPVDKQAPEVGREPNPQALKDDKGKDTTKDAEPDMRDNDTGHKVNNNKDTPGQCGPRDVNILHDENNPIQIDGVPQQDELYQDAEPGAGQHVEQEMGTVQSPYVKEAIDKESIFIGGGPTDQDIQQGEIGDCYFLAGLHQVISRDPGKIQQMMKVTGDTVTVNFWRWDTGAKKYVEQSIS